MRMPKATYTLCLFGVLCTLASSSTMAQDMQFSQAYSNPLYLNPAFAGTSALNRVMMNYRLQWPGIGSAFTSYGVAADNYIKKANGGIGLAVHRDIAGSSRMSNTTVKTSYSQHLRLSRKSNLALGLNAGWGQRGFDSSRLLFADQVIDETSSSLSLSQLRLNQNYFDMGAGMLYYNKKMWLGVSAMHLNRPNQSLMSGYEVIPVAWSVHGGTEVPIEAWKSELGRKKLRVAFNYKSQGEWGQLDLGGFFTFEQINLGIWYRGLPTKRYAPGFANHEALILLLGYEAPKHWSVGYSYDLTLSRLSGYSGGAHELALVYQYRSKKSKNQKKRIVPCAKF